MEYNRGIYGYFDLKSKNVVYIGKDSHIDKGKRKKAHKAPCNISSQPFNQILQKNLERYAYFVIAKKLKDLSELNFLEKYFIKLASPQFNFTEGGDGCTGCIPSKETRMKISRSNKGRVSAMKGKTHSLEARRKISEANKGRKHTEETKRKISKANKGNIPYIKGKHHSEETKRKLSIANKGKVRTEEEKQRNREAHLGKKHSIETRKKMSENNARYWKGKKFSREHIENNARSRSKYTLWDTLKTNYNKAIMFRNNKKGLLPRKCFFTRYKGKQVSLGVNYDFLTCEIISNLIKEECG